MDPTYGHESTDPCAGQLVGRDRRAGHVPGRVVGSLEGCKLPRPLLEHPPRRAMTALALVRYARPLMSLNVGGIYIKVKPKLTAARVRAAITGYWTARGAKPARVALDQPLALERTRQLAFAVLPPADGYICVADSERYHADFALAGFLADELATRVIWYTLYGATGAGVLRMLGPGRKPDQPEDTYGDVEAFVADRLPHAFVYFDKLGDPDPLGFSNVEPQTYDRGPSPDHDAGDGDDAAAAPVTLVDDPTAWPVRVESSLVESGELRVGHLVAFFLPPPFRNHVAAVAKVLELWLASVPREALRWSRIGASASESRAFSPQTIGRCRAQLTAKVAAKHSYFEIYGPEREAPQYYLEVEGRADDIERGSASTIMMHFPWSTPHDQLAKLARGVAALVDYSTGLVTPAVQFDDLSTGSRGRAAAARLAARHPGLALQVGGFTLGDQMHGAHWLAFLGPGLMKAIGGRAAIAKTAGLHAITDAGHGVCLAASAAPEVGDLLTGPVPAGLRAMARLLEPLLPAVPAGPRAAGPLGSPQLDDGADDRAARLDAELRPLWHRRFLDDAPRLRELATQLARLSELEAIDASTLADGALDDYVAALADVPYVSNRLGESLVALVRRMVESERSALAERVLAAFSATQLLGFVRYQDRVRRLLSLDSPALAWLIERATDPGRARIVASIGAQVVVADPGLAPAIVAAMPADTDRYSWDVLLQPINNHLGALWNKRDLVAAETLCDAIQPIAKHHAEIYLWTATIYIARERVDDAMGQIELMFEAGLRDWNRVRGDDDFAPLFDNPRFLALSSSAT